MTLQVTDETYDTEVIDSNLPVLVDFWASWCPPCRALSPIVDELAEELEGKVRVVKIDADANQRTVEYVGVRSLPTLALVVGGEVQDTLIGAAPKHVILAWIGSKLDGAS